MKILENEQRGLTLEIYIEFKSSVFSIDRKIIKYEKVRHI